MPDALDELIDALLPLLLGIAAQLAQSLREDGHVGTQGQDIVDGVAVDADVLEAGAQHGEVLEARLQPELKAAGAPVEHRIVVLKRGHAHQGGEESRARCVRQIEAHVAEEDLVAQGDSALHSLPLARQPHNFVQRVEHLVGPVEPLDQYPDYDHLSRAGPGIEGHLQRGEQLAGRKLGQVRNVAEHKANGLVEGRAQVQRTRPQDVDEEEPLRRRPDAHQENAAQQVERSLARLDDRRLWPLEHTRKDAVQHHVGSGHFCNYCHNRAGPYIGPRTAAAPRLCTHPVIINPSMHQSAKFMQIN